MEDQVKKKRRYRSRRGRKSANKENSMENLKSEEFRRIKTVGIASYNLKNFRSSLYTEISTGLSYFQDKIAKEVNMIHKECVKKIEKDSALEISVAFDELTLFRQECLSEFAAAKKEIELCEKRAINNIRFAMKEFQSMKQAKFHRAHQHHPNHEYSSKSYSSHYNPRKSTSSFTKHESSNYESTLVDDSVRVRASANSNCSALHHRNHQSYTDDHPNDPNDSDESNDICNSDENTNSDFESRRGYGWDSDSMEMETYDDQSYDNDSCNDHYYESDGDSFDS